MVFDESHKLHADTDDGYDVRVEEIAVGIAIEFERERGASVRDVSKPARARAAGLPS